MSDLFNCAISVPSCVKLKNAQVCLSGEHKKSVGISRLRVMSQEIIPPWSGLKFHGNVYVSHGLWRNSNVSFLSNRSCNRGRFGLFCCAILTNSARHVLINKSGTLLRVLLSFFYFLTDIKTFCEVHILLPSSSAKNEDYFRIYLSKLVFCTFHPQFLTAMHV